MPTLNEGLSCPYGHGIMTHYGTLEGRDALGIYAAETAVCPICGYRLEQYPVYLDFEDDVLPFPDEQG